MANPSPDWQLFRAFLAVMRTGTLSGAARMLGTTQPTMGRQVAALEAALACQLFVRSIEGLSPTDTALQLLPMAEAMAAAAEAARRAASAGVDEARGTVRVTASDVIGGEVLPAILASLQAEHPGIAVELVLSNRSDDLLRRDADIAVRMIRPTQDALVARRIGRIELALFAHRRYLKARGRPTSLADLTRHALIGYDRDPAYQQLMARLGIPITREQFSFRADHDLALLAALRAGCGIGASQIGIARRDRNLVPVLPAELRIALDMWLVMHRDLRSSRRVRIVFDHLSAGLLRYAQTSTLEGGSPGES